jgi:hypothetical protein
MGKKALATGIWAVAATVTVVAPIGADDGAALTPIRPVVFDVPLPRDPAPSPPPVAQLPTSQQLAGIFENLADPSAPYQDKSILVQGGLSPQQGHELDHMLRRADHNGELPLAFTADNIESAGQNTVNADITVTGPKLPAPITKNVAFTNQGGWILSYDSLQELMAEAMPHH